MTETGTDDPFVIEQRWELTYRHTADPITAHFLRTLQHEGRLLGIRCPDCERVLAPPRPICDRDFRRTEGWVELGLRGQIELFTIVHLPTVGLADPPYALAYVRPEGADTAIAGVVEELDLSDQDAALERLKIGAEVDIVLRPERVGRITDLYFRLR